ncbi:Cold-regulated protein 27 [Sesamum alatum]|uniref:Cold-regulated protein 27 n=1 Tax=Sesamum alatum TaxID=300844 RepID=A0AAE1YG65_9LAMI|nr:Cold-regulated protein 27 [Sesamum alatum]
MGDSADSSAGRSVELEQEETSTLMATESEPIEWTDEKHCLFLKSMESTFVNQLYKSIDLSGWHSHKNCPSGSKPSKHKLTSIRASSGQFKVLRDGRWSQIDFRRDEPKVDQEEESNVPLTNPWIQRYGTSQTQGIRNRLASSVEAPSATNDTQYAANNFHLWRQGSLGGNAEATDQNFNDEALEEEKPGKIYDMKKTRTKDKVSGNDQVVPFGNVLQVNDVGENHFNVLPKD